MFSAGSLDSDKVHNSSYEDLNFIPLKETPPAPSGKKTLPVSIDQQEEAPELWVRDRATVKERWERGSDRGSDRGSVREGSVRERGSVRLSEEMDAYDRNSAKAFALQDRILDGKLSAQMNLGNNHPSFLSANTEGVNIHLLLNRPAESNKLSYWWWSLRMALQPCSTKSAAYGYWNSLILLAILPVVVYTPYRLAFLGGTKTAFELAIDVLFIVNMGLHMIHFYSPAQVDYSDSAYTGIDSDGPCFSRFDGPRFKILVSYCSQWRFAIDVISVFPWDFIATACGNNDMRIDFALGFLRMIRLIAVQEAFADAERSVTVPYAILRIAGFLIFISVETHWFACIFYFVAIIGHPENNWIKAADATKLGGLPTDELGRYLVCLY